MINLTKRSSYQKKRSFFLSLIVVISLLTLPAIIFLSTSPKKQNTQVKAAGAKFYGVNIHPIEIEPSSQAALLDSMKAAGVQSARLDIPWNLIEPTAKGTLDQSNISRLDAMIDGMVARNIEPLGTVTYAPQWANNSTDRKVPPINNKDYTDFLNLLQNRWAGKVRAYEIWNEPDGYWSWTNPDPVKYTALLKSAYSAAKAVDPNVTILAGSLSNTGLNQQNFLKTMYQNGAHGYFDVWSQHFYGDSPNHSGPTCSISPESISDNFTNNMLPILQANGDGNTPVWITETGYTTCTNGCISEPLQGEYLTRQYTKALSMPTVQRLFYYDVINDFDSATNTYSPQLPEHNYGLLRRDLSKKPAYYAFQALAATTSPTVTNTATPTQLPANTPTLLPTATVTPTKTPTPTPTIPPTELLQNRSFENGTTSWVLNKTAPAAGTFARVTDTKNDGTYSGLLTVTTGSTNGWYVQFTQPNIPLTSGKKYTLKFWAKASANRALPIVLQKYGAPYTVYFNGSMNLTTVWQQYTATYQATASDPNIFLGFNIAQTTGSIWLDNVSLTVQ